jgi:cyclopropane-fatty-acyl-phospholipid synthase
MQVKYGTRKYKAFIKEILSPADITINGSRPWDIQVKDERFYYRIIRHGSLGLVKHIWMDGGTVKV